MKRSAPLLAGIFAALAYGQTGAIGTWSVQVNTPAWNKALGVTNYRQGCSDPPASCASFTSKIAQANNVRLFLAVPLNSSSPDAATQYSQLSMNSPNLVEVGIDDFVDQYKALFSNLTVQPATLVSSVIANLKSVNKNLKFGATIYEDQLTNAYLQDAMLPAAIRAQFDYVHLFIHYRQNGLKYADYVQQAKLLFPGARIIAGSYAYDRRQYFPCAQSGGPNCTAQQDFDLFKSSIQIQAQLLASGGVDAIEFFPGYFGAEDKYPGLNKHRECAVGDSAACIANTKAMRLAAYQQLVKRTISQAQIVSAASFLAGPLSPGEIVSLFGTGLGPPDGAFLQLTATGFVSSSIGGAQVLFDGVAAPLVYAQANQANVVVPYEVAKQTSTLVSVNYAGVISNSITLPVASSALALFTASASGKGLGAILNEDGSLNSPSNPARRGSIVVLYGTGEGQTTPAGVDGKVATVPLPAPVLPVSVLIGGMAANVVYAGAAPQLVSGVIQINARVPSAVSPSDHVTLEVMVGNVASQAGVTIAVQ